MINEVFDDDVDDEQPVKYGDHMEIMAGREIWFKFPLPGQFSAWKRYRAVLVGKFDEMRAKATKDQTVENLQKLREITEQLDLITIELFESLIVHPDDVDFLQLQMITGKVTMADIHAAMFGRPEPEDDAEPAPKLKKAAAKKAANAGRTKR